MVFFSILVSCIKYSSTAHIKDDLTASTVNSFVINLLANYFFKKLEFQLTIFETETEDINQQQPHIFTLLNFHKPHLGFSAPLWHL
jgi:hypothetical protein